MDASGDRDMVRDLVSRAVDEYQRRSNLGENRAISDPGHMVERIVRSLADYGPLTELLQRTDVEEIFIEGPRVTFIDGTGRLRGLGEPTTIEENRQVVDRLLASTDRRMDASSPIVQGRVLEGTARLTAVIPPIADQLSATIRRYALRKESLASLVELDSLTGSAAGFLWAVMQTNSSIMISGPPGAGKTSLLSAMLNAAPSDHCLRCCEEVRELHFPLVHGSFYEARPPGLDGSGEVSLRDLVKVVLAMLFRPHPGACSRHPSCAREASKWTHGCPSVVRQTTQNDRGRPEWTRGEIPCPAWVSCGSARDLRTLVPPSHGIGYWFGPCSAHAQNPL